MSEAQDKSLSIEIGLRDRQMVGWFNGETGEIHSDIFVRPGMTVVDVGCGDGSYSAFCSRRGANVTFVDIQEEKVKSLDERLRKEAQGELRGIVSDCNPIPLDDEMADLVISTEVLEHVQDPPAFLREIVRVGKRDATYLLTVPDARGEDIIRDIAHPAYFEEPNHIQRFTSDDFEALARDCGLEVTHHEYISGFWAIFYLFKWATSLPGESLIESVHPATYHWSRAWEEMLNHPNGQKVQSALNNAIPRCQVIVAKRQA